MARQYRKFDQDFQQGAVRLVFETGKPIAQVARELGINEGTLGNWCARERRRQANGDAAVSESERAELERLRRENVELPAEHAAVLGTDDSPAAMAGAALLPAGLFRDTAAVVHAFRTGEGITWGDHDAAVFASAERHFGALYRAGLATESIPALDGVEARLAADGQQQVAVVGVAHRGDHVGDVACPDHHRRVPVVLGVVHRARGVVVRVAGEHDLAAQPGRARVTRGRGHRNHRPGSSIAIPASTRYGKKVEAMSQARQCAGVTTIVTSSTSASARPTTVTPSSVIQVR